MQSLRVQPQSAPMAMDASLQTRVRTLQWHTHRARGVFVGRGVGPSRLCPGPWRIEDTPRLPSAAFVVSKEAAAAAASSSAGPMPCPLLQSPFVGRRHLQQVPRNCRHLASPLPSSMQRTHSFSVHAAASGGLESIGSDVATFFHDYLHNEALACATAACLVAQFVKPFTSEAGEDGLRQAFNWRLVFKSGGMPSSHSATVTALATGVCFRCGADDPLFAMAVVYACIVMYDAQGVRRAVGKQAEVLNTLIVPQLAFPPSPPSGESGNGSCTATGEVGVNQPALSLPLSEPPSSTSSSSSLSSSTSSHSTSATERAATSAQTVLLQQQTQTSPTDPSSPQRWERGQSFWVAAAAEPSRQAREVEAEEVGRLEGWRHIPLKESIGHTKQEVAVGAVVGVLTAIIVHSLFTT